MSAAKTTTDAAGGSPVERGVGRLVNEAKDRRMLKLKQLAGALAYEQLLARAAWKAANPTPPLVLARAEIGDVMACDVRHPHPQTLRLTLETQAAADKANKLLALEPKAWRLEKLVARHEPPNVAGKLLDPVLRGKSA